MKNIDQNHYIYKNWNKTSVIEEWNWFLYKYNNENDNAKDHYNYSSILIISWRIIFSLNIMIFQFF